MKQFVVYIALLVFALQTAQSQVTFKTTVSKEQLGLNERLRIEFSIDRQGGDDFTPPNFENFKVLAGPSQSSSFSSINGKTSYKLTYSYVIQPISKGTFRIPSASITYDGEVIKSNTVRVTVTDAVAIPKDPNDPRYMAQENIHLVAEISNVRPYVGESISVTYKLYVNTNKVNVQNYRESSSPSFGGFWNQNIELSRGAGAKNGTYGGKPYRYVVLKKAVLIPHTAGELELDPLEMEITAGVPMGQRDYFGNLLMNDVNMTVTSGRKTVRVKSLPEENKPLDFAGAVGDFSFSVTPSKTDLKANESSRIKVELSGEGNLKLVKLPGIETPNGLEVYEPEHKEKISTNLSGMKGSVYDQYAVVPQFRGKFIIPSVTFSYFNPKTEQYVSVNTEPIVLNAIQGRQMPDDAGGSVIAKRAVEGNESDIRYIQTRTTFVSSEEGNDFFGSGLFYLLMISPLLSIPLGIFIGKKKRERDLDVVGNKRRKADRLAKKYLSQAKKELGKKEDFYVALEKALHNYLKAKLHVETSEISKEKIAEILLDKNVDDGIITDFTTVLDNCDYARYTPSTDVMMKQEYDKAREVIANLDKQL
ncbi:MAG: BatD family protein [Lutimonas sp.]